MSVRAIILKEWAVCGTCGARLFKIYDKASARNIEIKCHQCKQLNQVHIEKKGENKNG